MSILKGQKLIENVKIEKYECDILSDFRTMWRVPYCVYDPLTVRLTLAIDGPLVIRISTICACPAHAAK